MVFGFVLSSEVKKINLFLCIQSSHCLSRGKGQNIISCFLQVIRFKLSSFCCYFFIFWLSIYSTLNKRSLET